MTTFRNAFYGLVTSLGVVIALTTSLLAQTATILPNAKTQFLDANGKPLVGGQVYFFVPNTSTPKTTWQDAFQATPNAQPVVLDSLGAAFIFGSGNYTETLYDVNNNLIWSGFTAGLGSALPAGIAANRLNTQIVNYTIATTDCGATIQAGTGSTGFFTITVPSVAGFAATCVVTLTNGDTARGKGISGFSGCSPVNVLWPLQTCTIGIVNGAWAALSRPGRWKPPASSNLNFYADFTNGTDVVGATDGLAPGASAFQKAQTCSNTVVDEIDYDARNVTTVTCNLAAATTDTAGIHMPFHDMVGASGGAALQIVGATLAVTGAISNGGLCEITVSATATYTTNQVVSTYSIGGATGCNGTWKVTVTDGTHLTLQGTTFGGAYTSGGTVTNGSAFNVTGTPVDCYFSTVVQFANITFQGTGNDFAATGGCYVYFNAGNIFTGSPAGDLILDDDHAHIHFEADIGIASGAGQAALAAQHQAVILFDNAVNINFVPSISASFSGLGFAYADTVGLNSFANVTINLNSATVTGPKCAVATNGVILSATGNANTFFPGNSNCTYLSGGVIDGVTTIASGTITGTLPYSNGGTNAASLAQAQANFELANIVVNAPGVNFNSVADTAIPFTLPAGYTRAFVNTLQISNANHTLVTATFGLFSTTAGGGTQLIATGTPITVSATADLTANNMQQTAGAGTTSFVAASLPTPNTVYFRVTNAEGAPSTADVSLVLKVLP